MTLYAHASNVIVMTWTSRAVNTVQIDNSLFVFMHTGIEERAEILYKQRHSHISSTYPPLTAKPIRS